MNNAKKRPRKQHPDADLTRHWWDETTCTVKAAWPFDDEIAEGDTKADALAELYRRRAVLKHSGRGRPETQNCTRSWRFSKKALEIFERQCATYGLKPGEMLEFLIYSYESALSPVPDDYLIRQERYLSKGDIES